MADEIPGFDPETRAMLEAEAEKLRLKFLEAEKIAKTPVPMQGEMHKILPAGKRDTAMIDYIEVTVKDVAMSNVASAYSNRPDRMCPPGTYTRLLCRRVPEAPLDSEWCVMMTDAPYEIRSSMEFIKNARGRVLIAGLGLGVTTIPVLRKKSVTSVTVIEKNKDVIDLVARRLKQRAGKKPFEVIHADAHQWKPELNRQWDTIWLDIWPDIDVGNLVDMRVLRQRFVAWLASKGWIGVWEWDYLHRQDAEIARNLDLMFAPAGGNPLRSWDPDAKVAVTVDGREIKL